MLPLPARPCHLIVALVPALRSRCTRGAAERLSYDRKPWICGLTGQGGGRYRLEPRAGPGERKSAGGRGMPRDAVRARREDGLTRRVHASRRRRPAPPIAVLAVERRRQHRRGRADGDRRARSRRLAASISWSTTSGSPAAPVCSRHRRREWQEAIDQTLFPGDSRVAAGRAAHAAARRRRDHHHRVDLRPRGWRPHDLQRGQGGRDQPGQVARRSSWRRRTSG